MASLSHLIAGDEASFLKKAAQIIVESAASAVELRRRFTMALSGGSTPKKLYALLADPYFRDRIPWQDTHLFFGDERCVSPDHADSNYKMTKDAMLTKLSFPESRVFRMKGEMTPSRDAARDYENQMRTFFKVEKSLPAFDLVLLGLGEDGHTASLFPGTPGLAEQKKWVTAHRVEKLNTDRITLTYPVLNNAHRVLFLVAGESKAAVLKEMFREDLPGDRYPAQRILPVNGELIWLFDKAAVSKLPAAATQGFQRI